MPRQCKVSVTDLQGITHSTTVTGESLFEAAARAIATFRQEAWATEALTPNAILHVEVQLPAVIHDVPLKAVEQWANGPSISPREQPSKGALRNPSRRR